MLSKQKSSTFKSIEEEKEEIEKLYATFKSKGSVYKTKDGKTMIKNNEPALLPIFNKRLREVELFEYLKGLVE